MQYPTTLDELTTVMLTEFSLDDRHDYTRGKDRILWLGIWRSDLAQLVQRIGPGWEIVERKTVHHEGDDFCRVDIIPKEPAPEKEG